MFRKILIFIELEQNGLLIISSSLTVMTMSLEDLKGFKDIWVINTSQSKKTGIIETIIFILLYPIDAVLS